MRMIIPVATAITLFLSVPAEAHAQAQAQMEVAAQRPPTPEEAAFEARTEQFRTQITTMRTDFQAAIAASGGDQVKGMADIDVVIARYQPDIDSFIADFEAYVDERAAAAQDPADREQFISARATVGPALRAMLDELRVRARQAIAELATVPAPAS